MTLFLKDLEDRRKDVVRLLSKSIFIYANLDFERSVRRREMQLRHLDEVIQLLVGIWELGFKDAPQLRHGEPGEALQVVVDV